MTKEVAMSDLTLIAEDILNTMQTMNEAFHAIKAMGEAHTPAQAADNEPNMVQTAHEEAKLVMLDIFRTKMMELHDRLSKLKVVLDNEEAYAVDELVDALSLAYTGHRAEYRKTPRLHE
jgi:hypothetical protein